MLFADISHHQATFDVAAYKAAGRDRIVLKASEGTGFVDPAFAGRWRAAGQAGLARVAYHYDRAKYDGAAQFDFFLSVVQAAGGLGPRDRLCLDTEDVETPTGARASGQRFAARALARGFPDGIVYTGRWFGNPYDITADIFPPGWRRLWLSHYDASVPDSQILMPNGWTRSQCVARQYTDRANVPGVGSCDDSRLLIEWLSTAPTPPEDFMAALTDTEQHELLAAARQIKTAIGAGQSDFAGTVRAILGAEQSGYNVLNAIKAAVGAQADDEAKVRADLATLASALKSELGGDTAKILGALAGMQITLTPEQVTQLADRLDLSEQQVAEYVAKDFVARLSGGAPA